ncbi:hypothetical protein TL16_g09610 [Triparma laevis f. inornata]|uniref:Uncharacterized protein n=1 Tax=Triparma laevis f. inornata TaxID=1714386 RepID=A0A9W7BBK3_9STRA|nr:hypothetical protein TL16_g09610 [Triparma laevis f. inornata]
MSKMTSEYLPNAIVIPDPNNLDVVDDEEEVYEGSEFDSAADDAPAVGGDDFMHTDDFRRLFVGFVMFDTLVAMRWLDRKWHAVVEKKLTEFEDEPFGEIIVHGGNNISWSEAMSDARDERMKQVTKVVFLLNITKVGDYACYDASNLIVVDIPEGITSIGRSSFFDCSSLTTVSIPTTLTSICAYAFHFCTSLENIDLLNTNLKEIEDEAFKSCSELKSMTIPDSLQTLGDDVFEGCSKLVPSTIDVDGEIYEDDVTSGVVAYLRSLQSND